MGAPAAELPPVALVCPPVALLFPPVALVCPPVALVLPPVVSPPTPSGGVPPVAAPPVACPPVAVVIGVELPPVALTEPPVELLPPVAATVPPVFAVVAALPPVTGALLEPPPTPWEPALPPSPDPHPNNPSTTATDVNLQSCNTTTSKIVRAQLGNSQSQQMRSSEREECLIRPGRPLQYRSTTRRLSRFFATAYNACRRNNPRDRRTAVWASCNPDHSRTHRLNCMCGENPRWMCSIPP